MIKKIINQMSKVRNWIILRTVYYCVSSGLALTQGFEKLEEQLLF